MYHTFFGLNEPAFSIAVNPRYLYMSDQHKEALAHLLYGVAGGGFVMLTGEVGTGKTTIIRCLLEQLPDNTDIAIVMNPTSNVPELLSTICDELNASYIKDQPSIKDLTDALHQFLLKNHTKGRNTVLLIDEAQLLSANALEQIRLLTNLETTTQKLLHIILVGQPELKNLLSQNHLRQLAQRITARFHLSPLTLPETQAYIQHRLKVAGMLEGRNPFNFSIIKRIHAFSGGIPRLINVICERCLIGAYANNLLKVDNPTFNKARKEVIGGLTQHQLSRIKQVKILASFALLCIVIGLIAASYFMGNGTLKRTPSLLAAQHHSSSSINNHSSQQSQSSSSKSNPQLPNYKTAENIFFSYLGLPLAPETRPCRKNSLSAISCEKVELHTWMEVIELNRPAIIVLATPEKFSTYVVIVGIKDETALIIDEKNQTQKIPLNSIGAAWTGEVYYLWKRPPQFSEPIVLGETSATVEWVAQQFAKLDKQKEALANDELTLALQERLKIFQRTRGLRADGSINQPTLMKLNEALNIDKTLLTDF